MTATPANAYLRTKILTASPAELRMMLLDGAVRFADSARSALLEKNYEKLFENATRCQDILMELLTSLRPDQSPELCQRLSALYTFLYRRMVEGTTTRDVAILEEVIRLLRFEQETWRMLLDQLNGGGKGDATGGESRLTVQAL